MQELSNEQIDEVSGGVAPAVAIVAVAVVKSTAFRAAVIGVAGAIGAGVGASLVEWATT